MTVRFLAIVCLFWVSTNFAAPLSTPPTTFDIKNANQQFDHLNLQLSVQNLDLNNLDTAVDTLNKLSTQAEQCVEDIQKKLNNVELLIKQGGGSADAEKEGADLVYLNNQQKELANEQAQCRLFTIRAKEAIDAYKTAIADLKQEAALTRGLPLWKIINKTIDAPPETKLENILTKQLPDTLPPLLYLLGFIGISFIASILILLRVRKSRFSRHYLRFKKLHIGHISLLAAFFFTGSLFTYLLITSPDLSAYTISLNLSGILFFYLSSVVLTIFLFKVKNIRAFFYWYSLDREFFQTFIISLLSFYAIALIGQLFFSFFRVNSALWQLCASLFILLILLADAYFVYYFCRLHRHFSFIRHHFRFIFRTAALILLACAIIDMLGYHTLTKHLAFSGFMTFIIIFITVLISQGINKFYLTLYHQQGPKEKLIKYFGYRKDQVFTEFLILKTVVQVIIIAIGIYLIGQIWGFATDFIGSIYDQFLHGVHVVNMIIYPSRIIFGMVVFCLLYLLFRAISTAISGHHQFEDEEETQVAVASILTYLGFGLALISGLLVAGFDFTGLAIIAGALSVGIGLGLQSIVNNFVSGLILLIEKPIRPGDRINVDGVEGFVKKIRVRSTQIISPAREDIIVPNSDLITRRVTNYVFSDKHCRVICEVGVAYGSDTHLVQQVLLDIANSHDEVIKSARNKPIVLFRSFADNSLMFQLVCLIKDVDKKSQVESELNFAIDDAFRKHHIDMPYPQRELHIKVSEMEKLLEGTKRKRQKKVDK